MRSILKFVKQVIATTLGVAIFSFLLFSLSYTIIVHKVTQNFQGRQEEAITENAVLRIKLNGAVVEHIINTPARDNLISLAELNVVLEQAAEDPKLKGIFIEIDEIHGGLDSIDALRQTFEKFKKENKLPIVVYSTEYNEVSLAFASVADYTILHPSGHVLFQGLSLSRLFYKRLVERFDIKAMFFQAGKYKATSMPYVMDHMTEHDKATWLKIMKVNHDILLEKIISKKGIKKSDLTNILQNQPFMSAKEALQRNLIDAVGFKDDADRYFNRYLKTSNHPVSSSHQETTSTPDVQKEAVEGTPAQTQGEEDEVAPDYISYETYQRMVQLTFARSLYSFKGTKVGILPMTGDIVSKGIETGTISEEAVLPLLKQYEEDDQIKVIVIIMDSPGGNSIPTATISHEIERIKKHKPIICLVRNGALSGGLHIAVSCSKIIAAAPGTPVGSIGVWSMAFSLNEAAAKHFSVDVDGVKTHEHANLYKDMFHTYTDKEKELIQKSVENEYKNFKNHVSRCKKLTKEQIEAVSEGRIFTAQEALDLKLIDEIAPSTSSSLQYAIDVGLELASIDKEKEEIQYVYPVGRIDVRGYITYVLRGVINKKSLRQHSQQGKNMYHAGYYLKKEGSYL